MEVRSQAMESCTSLMGTELTADIVDNLALEVNPEEIEDQDKVKGND